MFLYRSSKTALKNTQNSPLYNILKVTFPEIFKNEKVFVFLNFLKILLFKKFDFMAQ